jgi:hypothetical protein
VKLLAVVSALDLRLTFGATSAWWQLLKGLAEVGVEVVATPYAGDAVETPWWRAYPNPCRNEARAFLAIKRVGGRFGRSSAGPGGSAMASGLARRWVQPRWRRHLTAILERERDVAAVLVVNVPANHFTGIASMVRQRFSLPTYYLDGDMPMSLPAFGGYASGVRGYDGADLAEYEAVITNSEGVVGEVLSMGARRALTLHFAADPDLFAPIDRAQDVDLFCYAYGSEQREAAIGHMVAEPSRELQARVVVAGARLDVELGRAEFIGPVLTSKLRHWAGRSRLNLNVVRRPHATIRGSSCMRLFELAAMGCCIVSNPIEGLESWLEPEREVVVAPEAESVVPLYRKLLADGTRRRALGEAARQRVLQEHTYRHRARTLLSYLGEAGAP